MPIDPGPPPRFGSREYRDQAVDVLRLSSFLDPADPTTVDVSPGGPRQQLARHERRRRATRSTRSPASRYEPEVVRRADFGRALAEFWADGPKSETPPGHWNVIANSVGDELGTDLRIGGGGPPVDRLEWDVKAYLALNGAVHDAAIAAWGLKGHYDSIRPISMIRYLGSLGQSSDPQAPAYDPDGLPLVDDLVEVITDGTTASGERHEDLAGHEGEIAVRAWAGPPDDPETQAGGVRWMLADRMGPLPAADLRHALRFPATCPATARSAGRPPRC